MPQISYDVKGYNRVRNQLRKLSTEYKREVDFVIGQWTQTKRAKLKSKKYPPQSKKTVTFKTDRQRRYFFYALNAGIITVPYLRTGKLASSWSAKRIKWAEWLIDNSQPYTAWVVGRDTQSNYHKGNWWIAEDEIEKDINELTAQLTDTLEGLVE